MWTVLNQSPTVEDSGNDEAFDLQPLDSILPVWGQVCLLLTVPTGENAPEGCKK